MNEISEMNGCTNTAQLDPEETDISQQVMRIAIAFFGGCICTVFARVAASWCFYRTVNIQVEPLRSK